MGNRFDYNEEEVMKILSDPSTSEEQKKAAFDKYKADLLSERKTEIINKLNECAKENPMITQDKYIAMLKKYSNDDLSIPFDSVLADIEAFDKEMKEEYNKYLETEKAKEVVAPAIPETPVVPETPVEHPVITETPAVETPVIEETPTSPEEAPISIEVTPGADEEIVPDVTPFSNTIEANPFFDEKQKEVDPNDSNNGQRGNATAIIISIITIIIVIVIMYSIIRLK